MALRPDRNTRLRDRVTILRRAAAERDRYGNPVASGDYQALGSRWGEVREVGGGEALAGGALEARETATVRLRLDALTRDLGDAERVEFRGQTWNIIRRVELGFSRREIELTVRKLPGEEIDFDIPLAFGTLSGDGITTLAGDRLATI